MAELNTRQADAVRYISGPLLVLAGAGSGKTSVITRKIAYLINDCGYSAHHIAALTFTNKAAREMKSRVAKLVKGKQSRGLIVSTFHHLGLTMLRKEAAMVGLTSNFTLFDDYDAKSLVKEIVSRTEPAAAEQLDVIRHQISRWKNDLQEPQPLSAQAETALEQLALTCYADYNRMLAAYNAVDFDDLIRLPTRILLDHPVVLEKWQRRLRYLLVDEYQDTNSSQYQLVKLLVGDQERFTVVGDDDQSIYSWRGARPENLVKLQDDFPSLKVIKLEQNYRSTELILRAANQLITNNPHVLDKALWSTVTDGEPIRVIKTPDGDAEAERIVNEITHQRLLQKAQYRDFAVLYRSNHQARLLEMKLQQDGIPYRVNGGTSFFAKAEIKDVMSYLRLLINADDDAAFLRVINTPRREIGSMTLEKLTDYANQGGVSLAMAAGALGLRETLPSATWQRLERFSAWLARTSQALHTSPKPMQIIHELIDEIGYDAWLRLDSNSAKVAEKRLQNVELLLDSLDTMLTRADEAGDEVTIGDAIGKLVLRDILERQEDENNDDQVQLMTLHAAKGLEFHYVYIMGLEEEILPHRNAVTDQDIEEERRLLYVGITRARRCLALTYAVKRRAYGEWVECTPSRFVDELPADDVIHTGGDGQGRTPQTSRENAINISDLRALLKS